MRPLTLQPYLANFEIRGWVFVFLCELELKKHFRRDIFFLFADICCGSGSNIRKGQKSGSCGQCSKKNLHWANVAFSAHAIAQPCRHATTEAFQAIKKGLCDIYKVLNF